MDPLSFRAARAAADLLCPERCAACHAIVASARLFCHACEAQVNVLGPPECSRCGAPVPAGALCAPCAVIPTAAIRQARAWGSYRTAGAPNPLAMAVAAFKYRGAIRLGRRLASAMLARVPDASISLVAPVPLHPRRLRQRGYNQSAILTRHIAHALGRPAALRLLQRTRDTPSQTPLSARARAANMAGAFVVASSVDVRQRAVLVIDDVWTSGATARAVAVALRRAGARAVDVLTLARVL